MANNEDLARLRQGVGAWNAWRAQNPEHRVDLHEADLGWAFLRAGVFHHISAEHADLYFHEIGFRWSQRVVAGQTIRRSHRERERVQTLWDRIPPAMQLAGVLRTAVGRQLRRTQNGSISIKSSIAAFRL